MAKQKAQTLQIGQAFTTYGEDSALLGERESAIASLRFGGKHNLDVQSPLQRLIGRPKKILPVDPA